jgi:hypothetical protein
VITYWLWWGSEILMGIRLPPGTPHDEVRRRAQVQANTHGGMYRGVAHLVGRAEVRTYSGGR